MPRPRTQDPVTSTTVCVPASVLLRLQTLNTHRQRRGLAAKSPQALMREIIEANLTAYEAYEGYLWNPVANPSALPPVAEASHPAFAHIPPPVAPPGASFFPLPPPPPHAPTYTATTPTCGRGRSMTMPAPASGCISVISMPGRPNVVGRG